MSLGSQQGVRLNDDDLLLSVKTWEDCNRSQNAAAAMLGISARTLQHRLSQARIRGLLKDREPAKSSYCPAVLPASRPSAFHGARMVKNIENGVVIVGSDAHYWPNRIPAAHRAFVKMCKELKPVMVVQNGDVFDGAGISRHPSIGWEAKPTVIDEINACKERLTEIEDATPNAERIWTAGNHDLRFESKIANSVPEYARVHGVHLKDHFPHWQPCWSLWINDEVVIKHRYKGGTHATHNNTVTAGKSFVTGHLHSLKVTPYTDYNGTRFGVDTGTLSEADPVGPQFVHYLEDNPVNWRSGFAVLTFHNGEMLWPEIVFVRSAFEVEFRGQVIKV